MALLSGNFKSNDSFVTFLQSFLNLNARRSIMKNINKLGSLVVVLGFISAVSARTTMIQDQTDAEPIISQLKTDAIVKPIISTGKSVSYTTQRVLTPEERKKIDDDNEQWQRKKAEKSKEEVQLVEDIISNNKEFMNALSEEINKDFLTWLSNYYEAKHSDNKPVKVGFIDLTDIVKDYGLEEDLFNISRPSFIIASFAVVNCEAAKEYEPKLQFSDDIFIELNNGLKIVLALSGDGGDYSFDVKMSKISKQ